jgi:hypothetical protein
MKKPKLPGRILIGNVAYDIKPLPKSDIDRGVDGMCSSVFYHSIYINENQVGVEAVDTMIHEMLHAMQDIYRINLSHKQIYRLADALSHMVDNNPAILHWMQKTVEYADLEDAEQTQKKSIPDAAKTPGTDKKVKRRR